MLGSGRRQRSRQWRQCGGAFRVRGLTCRLTSQTRALSIWQSFATSTSTNLLRLVPEFRELLGAHVSVHSAFRSRQTYYSTLLASLTYLCQALITMSGDHGQY
jgi:hypothetical protein